MYSNRIFIDGGDFKLVRNWLIEKRKAKGYKQCELAKILGVTNQTLSNIERGYRVPSGYLALKIATELDFEMKMFYNNPVKKDNKNGCA